jgi:hypothetical protein
MPTHVMGVTKKIQRKHAAVVRCSTRYTDMHQTNQEQKPSIIILLTEILCDISMVSLVKNRTSDKLILAISVNTKIVGTQHQIPGKRDNRQAAIR